VAFEAVDGVHEVEVQPVEADLETLRSGGSRPSGRLPSGVHYVDLDSLDNESLRNYLAPLRPDEPVVFDLRGYPQAEPWFIGHLTDVPVRSAQMQFPISSWPDQQNIRFQNVGWSIGPRAPRLIHTAFLTDDRAISYSETILAIIKNYRLSTIVGTPTAGTNGNVNAFRLPGGRRMLWTGMRVLSHEGARHDGEGVQPDVVAEPTLDGVRSGRDEVLETAIALLTESSPRAL
jgi:hypothetical protein